MKRIAAILLALMILMLSPSALAHSHSSNNHHRYKLCTVRTCTKKSNHKHHGVTYRAHYRGDGHSYHKSNHH